MRCKTAIIWMTTLLASSMAIAQTTPPTTAAADPSTPKGALKSLALAMDRGDADAIRNLLAASNPVEQKIAGAMSDMAVAIFNMNKAMIDRFGHDQAILVTGDTADRLKQSLATIDAATEKIDGDTATVSIAPTRDGSMSLKKSNGSWKISVEQQARGLTPEAVDESVAQLSTQLRSLQDITSELQAGKYNSATEAAAALRTKVGGPTTAPATQPQKP